ncbi:cation:proton antiporter [Pontibacter akesuensis]|uniref:NhaP-type Na+/H+ or K+/H+ antiporter n=1 Tax=Pontibacter akesuensis TaxID=388950 RepID=A0A1I7HUE8_9BACT|nr:cation:proton antiporter [Pontibacter akesuensis]GHA63534.1 cation transporter [Pontibacter akesuensis]SFU64116.1 NhaP-type Na+/H+ or K+/H+ antiporter [Pontibacter akesuensis]
MDDYIVAMTVIGLAALSMTWVPKIMERTFISYPIVFLLLGMLIYALPLGLPTPDPIWQENYVVHLTELSVIISLMGTGLKIRRKFGFKNWRIPLRLVSITMLLCIAAVAFLGWSVLGFSVAGAVLLGAVLAPTDPVLAEQVQVGPPDDKEEDVVRFSLTAEAGLNDGSAFPFTWLAVVLAVAAGADGSGDWFNDWFKDWVLRDLLYRIVVGVGAGYAIGRGLAYLIFRLPQITSFPKAEHGFLSLSATLLTYGVTELLHGYGFIAVFVAALTVSNIEEEHEYHVEMHDFVNQVERIIMVILLMLFGGSLVTGILDYLTWQGAVVGLVLLFFIRPISALPSMLGTYSTTKEKLAVCFFGIRGIGSFFYLSFALDKVAFPESNELWSITAFIVMVSVILHGLTATNAIKVLDRERKKSGRPVLEVDQTPDEIK